MSSVSQVATGATQGSGTRLRAPGLGALRGKRLAAAVIAVSAAYAVGYLWIWLPKFTGNNDFEVFWSAAQWVAHVGFDPGIYGVEAFRGFQEAVLGRGGGYHPLPYPPTFLVMIAPLALMPQGWGLVAFMAVTLAVMIALMAGRRIVRGCCLAVSPAALCNVVVGQVSFLTAGLLAGGLRLASAHPWWGGALLGLLSFKPQLGVIVPVVLIAARMWRSFAAAAVVSLALPLPSLILGGWGLWRAWLDFLPWFTEQTARSVAANVALMASPAGALVAAGVPLDVAELCQIPVSVAVCVVMYRACARHGLSEMTAAAACVASLLVTPYVYFYDLTLAAFAALVLAEAGLRTGFRRWEVLATLFAWVLPALATSGASPPGTVPVALTLLLAVLLRRMESGPAASGSDDRVRP